MREADAAPGQEDVLNSVTKPADSRARWRDRLKKGTTSADFDVFVFDPNEFVAWGPFASDEEAERFIASDKYLQSWCTLTTRRAMRRHRVATYAPGVYHGVWPVEP